MNGQPPPSQPKAVSNDGTYFYTATTKITGITGAMPAVISANYATVQFRVNSGTWGTSASVSPGDDIQLRGIPGSQKENAVFTYGPVNQQWRMAGTNKGAFVFNTQWAGYGYQVQSLANADTVCLQGLTSSSWREKEKYFVDKLTVKSFLCDSTSCNNLEPNMTYQFATTSGASYGGATFTTNAQGQGPNESANNWNAGTYFGSSNYFWTGRAAGTTTLWATTPQTTGSACSNWTNNANTTTNGVYGYTGTTGSSRWAYSYNYCTGSYQQYYLLCSVTPY